MCAQDADIRQQSSQRAHCQPHVEGNGDFGLAWRDANQASLALLDAVLAEKGAPTDWQASSPSLSPLNSRLAPTKKRTLTRRAYARSRLAPA